MIFRVLIGACALCVLGSFAAAGVLWIARRGNLPRYRRLRAFLTGAGIGGALSFFVMELLGSRMFALSEWLAGVLVKQGFPKSVFEWSNLYFLSGAVFAGMAAGALSGWWLTRERVDS